MASKLVVDAVMARLAANWVRCPVVGGNTSRAAPKDGSAYLEVQFPVANEEHISLGQVGQRTFRESGGFRLVLQMPSGVGLDDGLQWIDELRALFRAVQFGGVSTTTASAGAFDDGNRNGNYYLFTAVVEFYADILA